MWLRMSWMTFSIWSKFNTSDGELCVGVVLELCCNSLCSSVWSLILLFCFQDIANVYGTALDDSKLIWIEIIFHSFLCFWKWCLFFKAWLCYYYFLFSQYFSINIIIFHLKHIIENNNSYWKQWLLYINHLVRIRI